MTKSMAGMQPYFFPYLGYWQLIDAVDSFVLFDEVQYIKQGWVNRNRVLKQGGGWQHIQVPVASHSMKTLIRDVRIAPGNDWRTRLLNKLSHYRSIAPYYYEIIELVRECLFLGSEMSISTLNARIVRLVCEALSIDTEIIVSSEHGFNYSGVSEPGDWALQHGLQIGATEIINPLNGIFLQNVPKLAAYGISLSALYPPTVVYSQDNQPYEADLSIIDVMMFNGLEGTTRLLSHRCVVPQKIEEAR